MGVRADDWHEYAAGDRVMTIDGYPGVITEVIQGPYAGTERYSILLDAGLGGGDYSSSEIVAQLNGRPRTAAVDPKAIPVEIRRDYDKGFTAGQRGSYDALGRADQRGASQWWKLGWMAGDSYVPGDDKYRLLSEAFETSKSSARTAARQDRPLLEPDEALIAGYNLASEDYPELADVLYERPDWVEIEPASNTLRLAKTAAQLGDFKVGQRVTVKGHPDEPGTVVSVQGQGLAYAKGYVRIAFDNAPDAPVLYPYRDVIIVKDGSKTAEVFRGRDGINAICDRLIESRVSPNDAYDAMDRAEHEEGTWITVGGFQVRAEIVDNKYEYEIRKRGSKTAAPIDPVWNKKLPDPIAESLDDPEQPAWWRRVVGPALDRMNQALPPKDRVTDLNAIPALQWCRFRRDGYCFFPDHLDAEGTKEAGYAVWIPTNQGICPRRSHKAQKDCPVSEPGPDSGESKVYPDATISWRDGGQRQHRSYATKVELTTKARRYSDVPLVCDRCGSAAVTSIAGGREGHTMLCPDCLGAPKTAMPEGTLVGDGSGIVGGSGNWRELEPGAWLMANDYGMSCAYDRERMTPEGQARFDARYGPGKKFGWQRKFYRSWEFKDREGTAGSLETAKQKATEAGQKEYDEETAKELARMRRLFGPTYGTPEHKTAASERKIAKWADLVVKARNIRRNGGVRVISVTPLIETGKPWHRGEEVGTVTAEVLGDHSIYQSSITREPGSKRVGMWECSCPWASYSWARTRQWKKYEGRMCSHVLALMYEAQAQEMYGDFLGLQETEDAPEWRTHDPTFYTPPDRVSVEATRHTGLLHDVKVKIRNQIINLLDIIDPRHAVVEEFGKVDVDEILYPTTGDLNAGLRYIELDRVAKVAVAPDIGTATTNCKWCGKPIVWDKDSETYEDGNGDFFCSGNPEGDYMGHDSGEFMEFSESSLKWAKSVGATLIEPEPVESALAERSRTAGERQNEATRHEAAGSEDRIALAKMIAATFGPEAMSCSVGRNPKYLYRSMSEDEYQAAVRQGYLLSDQRWDRQCAIEDDYEFPNYGTSAANEVAAGYLPERGAGRIVRIEVHPDDQWAPNEDAWLDGAPEFSTHSKVPMSRVIASPKIVDRKPPKEFYRGADPPPITDSFYGWDRLGQTDEPKTSIMYDEPQAALPVSYGTDEAVDSSPKPEDDTALLEGMPEDDPSGEPPMQPGDPRLAWVMGSYKAGADDGEDVAAAAEAFLGKQGLKNFSPAEKAEIIDEGGDTGAANLSSLDLSGTHYTWDENEDDSLMWAL